MTARSRLVIGLWLALVLVCVLIIARTEFSNDLSAFLPREPSPAQQILVEQLRDGVVSRLILVGIEGAPPATLAQISKQLGAKLRTDERFAAVNNGESVGMERDREFVWRNRYLLSPAVAQGHFSTAALRESLEEYLQLLGSPAASFIQKTLPNDPSGELLRLVEQLEGQSRPATRDGVWFSPDSKRALLVVQTKAAGYDIDAQEAAIARIRGEFAATITTVGASAPSARLLLTGPGVFSVSTRASIKGDALLFSSIATVLIATLLLVLYRSPRMLALGLMPVATGALAGIAAVSLGFGSVHGITLGFGVTLIGEGVDYAIYLFTQLTPETPAQNTLDSIWPTLRLGVLASICGFAAMLLSGFPGLAQLGLFSIAGLVVAVVVTRHVLPALLPAGFSVSAVAALAPAANALALNAPRLRFVVFAAVGVAAAALVAGAGPLWSDDLASLSPVSADDQLLDQQLRAAIGAPDVRHLIVVEGKNAEAALQASEAAVAALRPLVAQGALAGFDAASVWLPSRQMQQARQAAIPPAAELRANLDGAAAGLPFRAKLFEPFFADAAQASAQPQLTRADLQGTALALKVDALLVQRQNGGWAAMAPLIGVTDAAAISRALAKTGNGVLLDLKVESDRLYQSYRRQALTYSLVGAAAIVLLLSVSLRSPRRVFEVLAPLVAAVIVTTGVLVAATGQLSIFHLVGLLLVVAVGSNYSLFFDRQAALARDRERTVVSLIFANVSTVIGFGMLAFSSVPVLKAIGSTVGLGAVLSLIFAAVLSRGQTPGQTQ